jgi:hypothetical protein
MMLAVALLSDSAHGYNPRCSYTRRMADLFTTASRAAPRARGRGAEWVGPAEPSAHRELAVRVATAPDVLGAYAGR